MDDENRAAIWERKRAASGPLASSIPGLTALWSETTGDPRVLVAVLDGPVDMDHWSLAGARLEVIDAVVPTVADPASPATRHGTAVASLIVGQHSQAGALRGLAPGCSGLFVPIFGNSAAWTGQPFRPSCSQLDLARAIVLAVEHGASIINISAGQYGTAATAEPVLASAVALAIRRGALVVAAAGNDGCDCAHVPAALPGVLAVGGTDLTGRPLALSNWGSAYRFAGLLAPGAGLLAARAGGDSVVVAGTSFATAIVSGAAALLLSLALGHGRKLPAARLRKILLDSARKCLDDSIFCRRHIAGRLDLASALYRLRSSEFGMSDEFPLIPPTDPDGAGSTPAATARPAGNWQLGPEAPPALGRLAAPSPVSAPVHAGSIVPSEGCGCAACQAKAAAASPAGLVFALGQIGYDLISEARRDSICSICEIRARIPGTRHRCWPT